jgi:hypothetical protein
LTRNILALLAATIAALSSNAGKILHADEPGRNTASSFDVESPTWLRTAKYGVMVHYLFDLNDIKGNWNKSVASFDVNRFSDEMQSAGAAYVILTLGQNSGYYNSPNATYNHYTGYAPGERTSFRDLPMDLSDALEKRGIKLILYLPTGAPEFDDRAKRALDWQGNTGASQSFQERWEDVIREWSLRYRGKIAGWWFDGLYCIECYSNPDQPHNLLTLTAAAKAGNPYAIVAFNSGPDKTFVAVHNIEDYTAGEQKTLVPPSEMANLGPLQYHVLTYLGKDWAEPHVRFDDTTLINYIQKVNAVDGSVTLEAAIRRNGSLFPEDLTQLKSIRAAIRLK